MIERLPRLHALLLSAVLALLSACSSAPRETAGSAPAPSSGQPAPIRPNLRKGMTELEIRAAWGDPKAVAPGEDGTTILLYQFDLRTTQRMIATDMVEVPAFDPINGAPI